MASLGALPCAFSLVIILLINIVNKINGFWEGVWFVYIYFTKQSVEAIVHFAIAK